MVRVIGIEHRKYTSKKTGKEVEGYNVYVEEPLDGVKGAEGVRTWAEWFSPEMFKDSDIALGVVGSISYNRYGRVERFIIAG